MSAVEFDPALLRVEIVDSAEPGGQQVYPRPMGVRITHLPTGLIAEAWHGRGQFRNRAIALDMLLAGLTTPNV